ncbi:voltage-gated chloride channel family protein [Chryseobacterium ginsengisoli]|uniref:Voltage-gated chloride channel family protein n=1 Tax=Chryseobacterium ginsengisoli TaxID=363853 RepID=A0ABP9M4M4_9FLAO
MSKIQRNFSSKTKLHTRFFFRKYPALPYILKWLSISLIIGALVGTASAGFLQSLEWATNFRENHIWLIVFLPLAGFLVGLLYYYFGKDVEGGNNLLLENIHEPKQIIPFKMAPFVYLGTIITHFFGGSAGREGTALQMAGAIADQLTKPFKLDQNERKILIISAIAAGFGSVFRTPLAGAVFGLEVFLIGRIRYNAIFPAFVSAILADWTTSLWNVKHTHYHIDFIPKLEFLPILYSILAGIAFGICSAAFSKLIHWMGSVFKLEIKYPPFRPVIGGIIVAVAVFAMGTTRYIGLGIPTILESFEKQLPLYDFALKMIFTIVTLSAGFKGGEVTPLFFIGATLGSALSLFIPLPFCLLAGMGFVAVFAGATNTPLACILMGIELFGAECGIYIAIACIVSYLFSGNNSIYTKQKIGEAKNRRFESLNDKSFSDL